MQLVTIDTSHVGAPGARLSSGEFLDLTRAAAPSTLECWLPGTIIEILEGGTEALDLVRRMVERVENAATYGRKTRGCCRRFPIRDWC